MARSGVDPGTRGVPGILVSLLTGARNGWPARSSKTRRRKRIARRTIRTTYGFPTDRHRLISTVRRRRRPARDDFLPYGERSLEYEDFKRVVREAGERRVAQGGLVPIPQLRRQVPALDRRSFDDYVLALHREGSIHLLSHVEPDKLSSEVRDHCVVHPSGALLYWLGCL